MPNNPASRKAGALKGTGSANKLVRGAAQASAIATASSAIAATVGAESSPSSSTPDVAAIPKGIIVMWGGLLSAIPGGWGLCDGSGGRPDLRSLFIKGAAAGIDPGVTGGALNHTPVGTNSTPTFTGSLLGTHAHGSGSLVNSSDSAGTPAGTIDAHTTTVVTAIGAVNAFTGPTTHTFTGSALGTHTHTISGSTIAASAGTPAGTVTAPVFTGTSADYQPAFYSLAYIQKL